MVKKTTYKAIYFLGLISGIVCILLAIFSFLGYIPEIFEVPVKGFTGIVSSFILGISGFFILGAARMTKVGVKRATEGGIILLVFGCVAYFTGGAIGAALAILAGLLAIIVRYV